MPTVKQQATDKTYLTYLRPRPTQPKIYGGMIVRADPFGDYRKMYKSTTTKRV